MNASQAIVPSLTGPIAELTRARCMHQRQDSVRQLGSEERRLRAAALMLASGLKAILNATPANVAANDLSRANSLIEDILAWAEGGPVPQSAKRYQALIRATDFALPGHTLEREAAALAAMHAEYESGPFHHTISSLLVWSWSSCAHLRRSHHCVEGSIKMVVAMMEHELLQIARVPVEELCV